jgi:hypothetical protein
MKDQFRTDLARHLCLEQLLIFVDGEQKEGDAAKRVEEQIRAIEKTGAADGIKTVLH